MIKSIQLNTIPFRSGTQSISELSKFNYFFGTNGSGKTTISRIIAKPSDFTDCKVIWENSSPLECRVYNRDFIDENFSQPNQRVKGVFTLGKMEAETLAKIEQTKNDIDELQNNIDQLTKTLNGNDGQDGKVAELSQVEETYKEKFWKSKEKHADKLAGSNSGEGMKGVIGRKEDFKIKVLEQAGNKSELLTIEELEKRAITIFNSKISSVEKLPVINPQVILEFEKDPILTKRVIGKEDVDIAAIIKKLGNSDWVRQGLSFFKDNEGVCPFCQQKTDDSFAKSLNEYFDETFQQDNKVIDNLISNYTTESQWLQNQIQEIIELQSPFVDNEKLENEKNLLNSKIAGNIQKLAQKKKEVSQVVQLDSLENILDSIVDYINKGNLEIDNHNKTVADIRNQKAILTNQIWRFVVEELQDDIAEYKTKKNALNLAIENIKKQIHSKDTEKKQKENELRGLEKETTTIQTTKDEINKLLNTFGFKSFKLAVTADRKTYKLVRENGEDAHKTLSDGERSFVTFLYFYHLLKGSQEETGLSNNKVVVFDDPISSLDNDVLFIVSALIRELIQEIRDKKGTIKQIFILTHNIYFHKEVTFNRGRDNKSMNEETFWLVKKNGINSVVELQDTNPIKTSYELLWNEVKSENRNNATIQNTMRRILENYFKLLGNIRLDHIYEYFEGEDKLKCKSLLSWINDGSHSVFDEDFYTPLDIEMIDKYLKVFKDIFNKSGHLSHYNMMMGLPIESESQEAHPK